MTGALLGAALAAAAPAFGQAYDPSFICGPPSSYAPSYGAPARPSYEGRSVAVESGMSSDSDIAYCQRRLRSYDLSSGTYLGYDGMRHSCP